MSFELSSQSAAYFSPRPAYHSNGVTCSLPENKGATHNSSVTLDGWKGNGKYRFTISTFSSPVESFKSYIINGTLWKPSQIRKSTLAWDEFLHLVRF